MSTDSDLTYVGSGSEDCNELALRRGNNITYSYISGYLLLRCGSAVGIGFVWKVILRDRYIYFL